MVESAKWLLKFEEPSKYEFHDLNFWRSFFDANLRRLRRFMNNTYGQLAPNFVELLVDKARHLVEISIKGFSAKSNEANNYRRFTHDMIAAVSVLKKIVFKLLPKNKEIFVILDQLDRGWDGSQETMEILIGLILSANDLIAETDRLGKDLRITIFLRDDIYDQLRFQDKNKITQGSMVSLVWDGDSLRKLLQLRVNSSSGLMLEDVFTNQIVAFRQYPIAYMISRTLLRPRDIISFASASLEEAKKQAHFVDENHATYEDFEEFLNIIRELRTTHFTFSDFEETHNSYKASHSSINFQLDAHQILRLLVNLCILGVKQSGKYLYKYSEPDASSFTRRDFDPTNEFEVHEALKKSLDLIHRKSKRS